MQEHQRVSLRSPSAGLGQDGPLGQARNLEATTNLTLNFKRKETLTEKSELWTSAEQPQVLSTSCHFPSGRALGSTRDFTEAEDPQPPLALHNTGD